METHRELVKTWWRTGGEPVENRWRTGGEQIENQGGGTVEGTTLNTALLFFYLVLLLRSLYIIRLVSLDF